MKLPKYERGWWAKPARVQIQGGTIVTARAPTTKMLYKRLTKKVAKARAKQAKK